MPLHKHWTILCASFFLFLSPLLGPLVLEAAAQEETEIYDPIEPFNRGVFWFNDTVDVYALEPIARGYDYVVPNAVQRSVENFFNNLKFPVRLVSDLFQGKFEQMGDHTSRFILNTTFGVAGLFDAAEQFGIEAHHEDIGTMLGYHGVGPGPYIVLPFLGPSNARDAFGKVIETALDPIYYLEPMGVYKDDATNIGAGLLAADVVNTRSRLLDAVESAKEASLDYYLFVRKAYYQIRYEQIYDEAAGETDDFEDEFEEELDDELQGDYKEELEKELQNELDGEPQAR